MYLSKVLLNSALKTEQIVTSLFASMLIAVGANVCIPIWPVPFTLQTTVVIFLAAILGRRLATMSVVLYILEGLCGLPVFAGLSYGPSVLFGPTGGYILGFVVSAYVAGTIYKNFSNNSVVELFLFGIVCEIPLFVCGFCWLTIYIGIRNAFVCGIALFIFSTIIKNIFLAFLLKSFRFK